VAADGRLIRLLCRLRGRNGQMCDATHREQIEVLE